MKGYKSRNDEPKVPLVRFKSKNGDSNIQENKVFRQKVHQFKELGTQKIKYECVFI